MLALGLPDGAMPLVLGTALALGGLTLVLWPLVSTGTNDAPDAAEAARIARVASREAEEEASDGAVAALREIEFDRATGKLSDSDYAELKTRYTKAALNELREADAREHAREHAREAAKAVPIAAAVLDAPAGMSAVDAAILRAKARQTACGVCGPRPEPDAIYCSSCGRYLPGNCGKCGSPVELVGSRFCSGCGEQLAAA